MPQSNIPPSDAVPVRLPVAAASRSDQKVGSPMWWLESLSYEMDRRQDLIWLLEDYFAGRHKMNFASGAFRDAFGQMLASVSDNWLPLVVNASVERLKPQGFTFGGETGGDSEAWGIWQRNQLDADAPIAFTEAVKHGESYLLVWPEEEEAAAGVFGRFFQRSSSEVMPRITVEHPSQMIVRRHTGDRRRRAAALKRWREDDGSISATLYLPDEIHYFTADKGGWSQRRPMAKNPLGIVPVIPLVNEPQMLPSRPPAAITGLPHDVSPYAHVGLGRSDMTDVISTVDQINKLLADMLVASEVAAFKQRWATGLDIPEDENGDPIQPFKAAVDRVWISDGADARFGEFSATDLSNYHSAIEQRIQSLAARTRTPPHYLLGSIVNASGDALKAAEAGLASKVSGKKMPFGEAIEEAIRLSFAIRGDERANDLTSEVVWAPSETRSESEYVDSLVKKMAIGVPKEQLWEDAGYSPTQIERFKAMLVEEGVTNDLFALDGGNTPQAAAGEAPEPSETVIEEADTDATAG